MYEEHISKHQHFLYGLHCPVETNLCYGIYDIFSCYNLENSPPCGLVFNGQKDPISQEFGFIRLNQTSRLNLAVPQMRLFWDELNFPEKYFVSAGRCLPWGGARHLAELTAEGETDSTILLVSEYLQVHRKK